jgi:alpha-ketoglutaric semialdehyde dehydrogenase
MMTRPVLIAGQWRDAHGKKTFQAENPEKGTNLVDVYPVSGWADCDDALAAAASAAEVMREMPGEHVAVFLECYATRIEDRKDDLVAMAHQETGLPVAPRLSDVELPRTVNQLRQAAAAARDGSWTLPTIDTKTNIRSMLAPIGAVAVFGPNNFPFAFNSIAGGDFAAAIAAGNPVIAKANSSHPGTTRLFAEEAEAAALKCEMPPGTVQMIYRTSHADGERLVADPRIGATGYTGSRHAGVKLKAAADAAGKPIYLELSSVNPVVILPGALHERMSDIAKEFTVSCLMGTGQFCTNPGLVVLLKNVDSDTFLSTVGDAFSQAPEGTLLSSGVLKSLESGIDTLCRAGAKTVVGHRRSADPGFRYANTLLCVSGEKFLSAPSVFQTEAFGNASLFVVAEDIGQVCQIIDHLEGNLTGCIYSHRGEQDDEDYKRVAPVLRHKVGRLLNDQMPTGVAVSPAMNHGGPFPATGHPGFTAVGIPAALRRFGMLQCFDNVREYRLPPALRDRNPNGAMWRCIDNRWSQGDV